MGWQRIASVTPARPVVSNPSPHRGPGIDAALFEGVRQAALPVATEVTMRASIALPAAGLAVGDVLHVQVLGTRPGLDLGLIDAPRRAPASDAEPAALRPDPLQLYQVRWARPEGSLPLAVAWRALALERLGERQAGSAVAAHRTDAHPADAALVLQAWRGLTVSLRYTEPEPDERRAQAATRGTTALRLVIELPRLGRVAVQLQLAAGGLWLAIAIEQPAAVDPIRAALPALSQALLHAGLRLLRCRLERGRGFGAAFAGAPYEGAPSATMLPLALFRAATEVVLALTEADSA